MVCCRHVFAGRNMAAAMVFILGPRAEPKRQDYSRDVLDNMGKRAFIRIALGTISMVDFKTQVVVPNSVV